MKSVAFLFVVCAVAHQVEAAKVPMAVAKFRELFSALAAKVIAEGEAADKEYKEFLEVTKDLKAKKGFAITTGEKEVEELKAAIDKETGSISTLGSKIEELAGTIASEEADLAAATKVRETEAAEFAAESKELKETMDMISRAIAILERELSKMPSASMLQLPHAASVTQALAALVQASMLSSTDASKLTALVQNSHSEEDSDELFGAPAAAVYESKSGGIIGTLEGLMEKAQEQLSSAQKAETESLHAFDMLKQSAEDEVKFSTSSMAEKKKDLAAAKEALATAQGDLANTEKALAADREALATADTIAASKATEYEAATKTRAEELATLAKVKEILAGAAGAAAQTYGFVQISRTHLTSGADLANFEAVRFVRDLAQRDGSKALAQLASRIASVVRHGAVSGEDPFSKVKTMISNMLAKLMKEAGEEAEHKAYCDKEMKETAEKKEAKTAELDHLGTKIDSATAKAATLKEELADLSHEIAETSDFMAEYTKLRQEEHATYSTNAPELKAGIEAVKQAIVMLKDYYAEDKARSGAASGVISMLEVAEADFSKGLVEMEAAEATAAADYEKTAQETKINLAVLEKDVEYKTKEEAELQKTLSELHADDESLATELDAILEYDAKIKEMCIAKAEPYAAKKERREKEIAGLKEALSILEGEAALMQRSKSMLRGTRA